MKLFHFLIILNLFSSTVYAQSNYKPAEVITSQNDTLKGYIDYREWTLNPISFKFKSEPKAAVSKTFGIADVKAFSIIGMENFKRYEVKLSIASANLNNLAIGIDSSAKTETIFLRTIATGPHITLYAYNDKIKQRYFVQEEQNHPYELISYIYYDTVNNSQIVYNNRYRKQLTKLAVIYKPGDTKLIDKVQAASYSETSLTKLIDDINEKASNATKHTFAIHFFAGGAVNFSKLKYTGETPLAISTAQSNAPIFPSLSIGADFWTNANIGRVIFRAELAFSGAPYKVEAANEAYSLGTYVREFNQYTGSFTPQILFNFYNKNDFKVYIGTGVSLNVSKYTNNQYGRNYTNPTIRIEETLFKDLESIWYNFSGKTGFVFNNRFEISAGYALPTNINRESGFSARLQTIQIGFHYIFK